MRARRLPISIPLVLLALAAPARAEGPVERDEVRVGYERALGWGLATGALPFPADVPDPGACSDPGWHYAAPPERAPAHRAVYPYFVRIEPHPCPEYGR
jgi:hypothetical protein